MKKLLFGLIAMVMITTAATANVDNDNLCGKPTNTKIETDRIKFALVIDWGRKSQNCKSGFGICSITIEVDWDLDLTSILFKGGADENGKLLMDITSRGMESIRKHFGSDTIVIEEDYRLTDEACKTLGLKSGYTIKAGRYRPAKTTTAEYAVVF